MENCNYRNQNYRGRVQSPGSCRQNNSCNVFQNDTCQSDSGQNRGQGRSGVDAMPLAMAYVPWQRWKETYDPCRGLQAGTIFPELYLPFLERSCGR